MSRTFWNLAGFFGGVGLGVNLFLWVVGQVFA